MATKEEIAARKHARYIAHRAEAAEKQRIYKATRRDAINANARAYRAAHRDELIVKQRAYVERNRELYRTASRAYEERNREARNARLRANPEYRKAYAQIRRARELENGGTHTHAQWRALCAWFGNVCLRCGKTETLGRDHVVPVTKGGTNDISNMQPLCRSCNTSKQTGIADYRDPALLLRFLESLANED